MSHIPDSVIVATAREGRVLAYAAETRQLVQELRQRHDTWPVVTAALGRVATVGAILTATLKHADHQITIQLQGNGPVGRILATATGHGTVKGYADEPHVDLPLNSLGKLDVGGAVGREGTLYMIKDLGLKAPYRGKVPLVSGEIGEDFTYYFSVSEQTPSAVSVGVLVDRDLSVRAAGGFLLQMLPEAEEADVKFLEEALAALPSITSMLDAGMGPEGVLGRIFGDDLKVLEIRDVHFACTCNKERLAGVLLSLGRQELENLLVEQGEAELVCHFCSMRYHFNREELLTLHGKAKY